MRTLTVVVALTLFGCDTRSSAAKDDAKAAADGTKAVPNIQGIRVKVPDSAVPNGLGGAAGFHTKDKSFGFKVMEVSAANQAKTIDQIKTETEEMFFKKWIKSEATSDGWVLTWEAPKLDLSGDEAKEVGVTYSFEVRKKVGDRTLKCYGSVEKSDGLDAVVKACTSLKAG